MIFMFFGSIVSAVNAENIDVSVSAESIRLWESLDMIIEISSPTTSADLLGDIRIEWIENFEIFSQSSWYSFQNINGNTQTLSRFTLNLRPIYTWDFELWPTQIETASGSLENTKIFRIQVSDILGTPSHHDAVEKQEVAKKIESQALLEKQDIRGLRSMAFPYLWVVILCIIFLVFFYLIIQKVFLGEGENIKIQNTDHEKNIFTPWKKESLILYFSDLEKKIHTLSSQEFFSSYNDGVREVFSLLGYGKFQNYSLEELQKTPQDLQRDILEIYEASYMWEYTGEEISSEKQHHYIKKILHFLNAQ